MSFQDGAIFQAVFANNRLGRVIRTIGAIAIIIVCSFVTGITILGPMLANAANIKPGAVYTVQPGSENLSEKTVEPKAPPLEISSKTDPDMLITPLTATKKSRRKKKAVIETPAPQPKHEEETKTIVPPAPAQETEPTEPETKPQKPDPKVDGDTGKIGD